ncbi:MAG: DUF2065 domain-containing protein [Pseudomonadota bacterium]
MAQDLITAFALYLVLEGLLPFVAPRGWKRLVAEVLTTPDGALRVAGLVSMLAGVALLYFAR